MHLGVVGLTACYVGKCRQAFYHGCCDVGVVEEHFLVALEASVPRQMPFQILLNRVDLQHKTCGF